MYKWRKMGDIKDFSDFVIKPGANYCKIATTLILHFFSAKKKKKTLYLSDYTLFHK
jgi:hypothetical protein